MQSQRQGLKIESSSNSNSTSPKRIRKKSIGDNPLPSSSQKSQNLSSSSSSSLDNSITKSTNKINNHNNSSSSGSSSNNGGGGSYDITDDGYEERFNALLNEFANEDNDDNNTSLFKCFGCNSPDRICGLKVDTIIRFFKVITAYPFVIVVSSLNLSNKYAFLR
jgi:hypothetical protein